MESSENKLIILELLKARNAKEHSFKETITYSNKLLEKVDYLLKANAHKNYQAYVSEQNTPSGSDNNKFGDSALRTNNEMLQKNLTESHEKISYLAEQVLNLKDLVDESSLTLSKQNAELESARCELKKSQDRCRCLESDLIHMKNALQNKTDEYDVLNISHTSVEIRRNALEMENNKLHAQISRLLEEREMFLKSETQKNYLEKENKKILESLGMLKENLLCIESQKNDLEIENKKLLAQIAMLKEGREGSSRSGSVESVCSVDSAGSGKKGRRGSKIEGTSAAAAGAFSPRPSTAKTKDVHPEAAFPDKKKISFIAHDDKVNAVMWYPDPTYLITAGSDRKLKLWEMRENSVKLLTSARDCNSAILSIDIDRKANSVLCASADFSSRLWDVSDFKLGHTLTGHSGKVMSAKFINENDTIISGSLDKTLKLWAQNKTLCTQTFNTPSPVHDVINKDSISIISGHYDRKIRFWDVRTKNCTHAVETPGIVTSLDVSKSGFFLLASVQNNQLKIFDLRAFRELRYMTATNFSVVCNWTRAKFSPDGKYCCCGSDSGSAFIWNSATGALEKELKGHESSVISCSWSLCGYYLATCDSNKKCIIWSK